MVRRRRPNSMPWTLEEPRRILVAGDVHMDSAWMRELIEIARAERCQTIVQLGDLGFFPRRSAGARFLARAEERLGQADITLVFIDGNHDDLDSLAQSTRRMAGPFAEISEYVLYAPRGTRFEWCRVRFLAVGGAYSIDQGWRIRAELQPRTLWWPNEVLSDSDVELASRGGDVDIVLAHDCPAGVEIPGLLAIPDAEENRRQLARVVDATRPQLLLHGHFHFRIEGVYENTALGLCVPTIGLAAEHNARDSYMVIDLDKSPVECARDRDPDRPPTRTDRDA